MDLKKLIFLIPSLLFCQPQNNLIQVNSAPAGSCVNAAAVQRLISSGHLYSCQSGTWVDITGSGGAGGTVTSIASGGPITISPNPTTTTGTLGCNVASGSVAGCLASADWTTFNNKQAALGFTPLNPANNLSEVVSPSTSLSNLAGAPLASPNFTGTPAAPTATAGDNTTQLATDAFVTTAVNNAIAGVNPAVAVQAATAAILPNTPTFTHVDAGIGSFFTSSTNSVLVIDGYTPLLNDRILVKNQASTQNNGVYKVTQLGVGGVLPWIILRALDFDQPSDINNTGAIPVINGTANANTQWVVSSSVTTVDTDPITFAQFSLAPSTIVVNNGINTGTSAFTLDATAAAAGAEKVSTPVLTDKSLSVANTAFVQGLIGSLNTAVSVQAATVTVLPNSPTYNNGAGTLTAGSNGALTIDGYTVLLNDRVLINNQASQLQNGVYTQTTLGTAGVAYVLTRATDFNTVAQINASGAIPVLNGTVNNNTIWVLDSAIATLGTSAIHYSLGSTTPFPVLTITNAGATGTTLQKLAKLTGAPSTVVISATTDTSGAVGICVSNCGTTGVAQIAESGINGCIFDGATTAGDYVQISSGTAGDCHDAGSAFPTSGEVVGRVLSTNSAGGTFPVLLFSPDVASVATKTIAQGTLALATGAISSGTCTSAQTATATGALTTDNLSADFNADPTGTTGYAPSANGGLFLYKYLTSGTVNVKVCNNTSASITPGAATLQWRVIR